MQIELLYFDGRPNYQQLLAVLRRILAQRGISEKIVQRKVESGEAAVAERFLGSPTLRVGGADVEPGSERRSDFALKCRLYRDAEGRA